ncbi:MAG: hypothetical protein ACR2OZ_04915 [Verrucomicrobiales bacterium]
MPIIDLVQNNQKARIRWRLDLSPPAGMEVRIETADTLGFASWQILAERSANGQWTGPASVVPGLPIGGQQPYSLIDPTPIAGKTARFYRLEAEEVE